MCLATAVQLAAPRDWFDYAQLASGALGAVGAIVALVVALRSAGDAKRSANASEASAAASRALATLGDQELALARRQFELAEAERLRRPEFEIHFRWWMTDPEAAVWAPSIIELGVRNIGDRVADQALVTLMVPHDANEIEAVRDQWGSGGTSKLESVSTTNEPAEDGGPQEAWIYTSYYRDLPIGVSEVRYFYVVFPQGGGWPIKAKVEHASAPNGGTIKVARLDANWGTPPVESGSA